MSTDQPTDDVRNFSREALDALREVANIGAGHAATALSQITGQRIMISVPHITVAALESVPNQIAAGEDPVAAIAMRIDGDLTGVTLLIFPQAISLRIAGLMMGKEVQALGTIEESALKEAGNILSGAYLNALAEFLEMRILNSPPALAVDMSDAVLNSTYLEASHGSEYVFCVESEFQLANDTMPLRGYFLLLPDPPSLRRMLEVIHVT
ncbi:MAG: chemotaxis protein CheC [Gemmatimonadaceae bacterium]|nr:chemotaxis protein CheC [Gemmatimonadaceae bacterium]